MINQLLKKIFIAIAWTIIIQVLLCLPGSTIPSGGLFSIPQLDKLVHIFLFGSLTWLWCFYFKRQGIDAAKLSVIFFAVYVLAAADGILMEFVQRDYIPNRSFDTGDIIADMAGASVAYGICNIRYLVSR